jgi:hypothetical protein
MHQVLPSIIKWFCLLMIGRKAMVGMAISVAIMVVLTLTRGKAGCPFWKAEMTWLEVTGGRWRHKFI